MRVSTGVIVAMFDASLQKLCRCLMKVCSYPSQTDHICLCLPVTSSKSRREFTTRQSLSSADTDCWRCVFVYSDISDLVSKVRDKTISQYTKTVITFGNQMFTGAAHQVVCDAIHIFVITS